MWVKFGATASAFFPDAQKQGASFKKQIEAVASNLNHQNGQKTDFVKFYFVQNYSSSRVYIDLRAQTMKYNNIQVKYNNTQ